MIHSHSFQNQHRYVHPLEDDCLITWKKASTPYVKTLLWSLSHPVDGYWRICSFHGMPVFMFLVTLMVYVPQGRKLWNFHIPMTTNVLAPLRSAELKVLVYQFVHLSSSFVCPSTFALNRYSSFSSYLFILNFLLEKLYT